MTKDITDLLYVIQVSKSMADRKSQLSGVPSQVRKLEKQEST